MGDKLEVKSLRDPQVTHWREQALGENAPWAPTLIENIDDKVRAWTGPKMGLQLVRFLGPVATWRVMQVLGELRTKRKVADSTSLMTSREMDRGQFLRGVGGAIVAMSMVSGVGAFASPAKAAQGFPKSLGVEEMTGKELSDIARTVAEYKDIVNVVGKKRHDKWQSSQILTSCQNGRCYTVVGSHGNCSVRQTDGEITVEGDCALVRAMKHQLEDGRSLLAVVYETGDQVAVYYEYDKPWSEAGIKSEAMLWRVEGNNVALIGNPSRNGVLDVPVPRSGSDFATAASDPCGSCPTIDDGPGAFGKTTCTSCVKIAIGGCILSGALCATCVGTSCPAAVGGGLTTPACVSCLLAACPSVIYSCCDEQGKTCCTCGTGTTL